MGCGRDSVVGGFGNERGCVCEVVRAILDIQNQANDEDCPTCTTNCFLEPLGGIVSPARKAADTRVFKLLTKTGMPFMAQFSSDLYEHCTSVFFRVEDIFDDCCATLRVLVPLYEHGGYAVNLLSDCGTKLNLGELCEVNHFAPSDSCITVDLNCFCAVQCVADVDLDICCN